MTASVLPAPLAAGERRLCTAGADATPACLLGDRVEVRRERAASSAKVALGRSAVGRGGRRGIEWARSVPIVRVDGNDDTRSGIGVDVFAGGPLAEAGG